MLRARAVVDASTTTAPAEGLARASARLSEVGSAIDKALDQAGKHGRVIKRRLAAAERLGDARDDLQLAAEAVAEARSTRNFDPDDIDDVLREIGDQLQTLAQLVARSGSADGDGLAWLRAVGALNDE